MMEPQLPKEQADRRRSLRTLLVDFGRDEQGVFAIIFSILAIVLIALAGAVVDYAHVEQVKTRAQLALDSASLGLHSSIYTTPTPTSAAILTKANNIVTERLADSTVTVNINSADVSPTTGTLTLGGTITVPTAFVRLIGFPTLTARLSSESKRGSTSLEVAASLDITGSMSGNRITSLQTATRSLISILLGGTDASTSTRIALIPWSMGVNVGSYASAVRGPVTGSTGITNAVWKSGSAKTITNITRANPAVVTAANHGFSSGDKVYISCVKGMTQVNGNMYTVGTVTTNTFTLSGVNTSGRSYSNYSSSGTAQKCLTTSCEIVVTSASHGLSSGDVVYITGVSGMTELNDNVYATTSNTTNTFVLSGTFGPDYSTYSSGGNSWCTEYGCTYYYFQNANSGYNLQQISNCVSERTTNAYTDTAPSTTYLGMNYPSSSNDCSIPVMLPLTNSSTNLNATVDDFVATGSTAGQLGVAWAWYALSPNFAYIWPTANQPVAYNTSGNQKIAIIMTDGDFNTPYCTGVIAADAGSGSGSSSTHINCNSPNGSSSSQATSLCTAMKNAGIKVYTIGFTVTSAAQTLLTDCSSGTGYNYFPTTNSQLESVFTDIANSILNLRVTK